MQNITLERPLTKFRTAGAIFVIRHLVGYLNRTPMHTTARHARQLTPESAPRTCPAPRGPARARAAEKRKTQLAHARAAEKSNMQYGHLAVAFSGVGGVTAGAAAAAAPSSIVPSNKTPSAENTPSIDPTTASEIEIERENRTRTEEGLEKGAGWEGFMPGGRSRERSKRVRRTPLSVVRSWQPSHVRGGDRGRG